MNEDSMTLELITDASSVQVEVMKASSYINTITRLWVKTKRMIMKEGRQVLRGMGRLIYSVKLTMNAVGQTLDPAIEAILTMVTTTVTAMTSISLAYAAGGPLGWASMILAGAGLAFALAAQTYALVKGQEVQQDMAQSIAIIDSWAATFSSFAALGG